MKKTIGFSLALFIFLFCSQVGLISCTKTNTVYDSTTVIHRDTLLIKDTLIIRDTVPLNPIAGLWVGSSQNIGLPSPGLYYSLDVRADQSLVVQGLGADGNTYYGVGTWALSGTSFTSTQVITNLAQAGVVQTIVATYSKAAGTLTGSINNNGTTVATFSLSRIN
jgi:hypothetical protein